MLEHEPENVRAIAALAKLQLDLGELEAAKHFLAMAPADKAADPALASVRAAIELAEQAASLGDMPSWRRKSRPIPRITEPI